jgi:hypothetical protein
MRWTANVAFTKKTINGYSILIRKPEVMISFRRLGVVGRMLKQEGERVWTGIIRLRLRSSGGLL